MPSNRTQQQTADLFQAAAGKEYCRPHTPPRLTPARRSAAAVSGAKKLSSRHVLPRDLSNALKQWDDGELDRFFAATRHELQRRGASDQSTTTEESHERRQPEEANVAWTRGQGNAR